MANKISQSDGAPASCLKVDELHEKKKFDEILEFLLEEVQKKSWENDKECAHVYWRLARAHFDVAGEKPNDPRHKESHYREGLEAAEKSLEHDDSSPFPHKWIAIILSALGDFLSTKEKIQNSTRVKKHADKAIELKPDDASTWHLIGRWNFAIASISWLERKVAATLIATPPEATFQDALDAFTKADECKPNFIQNALWAGNSCAKLKDKAGAKKWYDKALAMEALSESDKQFQTEAAAAKSKL